MNSKAILTSGFDYVELYVGNVRQAAHYYRTVWGFSPVAFRGRDAGYGDRISLLMSQGNVRLLLTGASDSSSPVAQYLRDHGEGVAGVALAVDSPEMAYQLAIQHGGLATSEPKTLTGSEGRITSCEVMAFANLFHPLIDRSEYKGAFLPGFKPFGSPSANATTICDLDHVAIAVESGTLDSWVAYYQSVFGFKMTHQEDVYTQDTGMNSRVVEDVSGLCKFPLVEPVIGKRKSQVQEFLDFNRGAGVQHLAFRTPDIFTTVSALRRNGVEFLPIPGSYYELLETRMTGITPEIARLRDSGVLLDADEWGCLLQVFARPHQDRPTLFFELIERRGARGFGGGNIRALFEAVEREQLLARASRAS